MGWEGILTNGFFHLSLANHYVGTLIMIDTKSRTRVYNKAKFAYNVLRNLPMWHEEGDMQMYSPL